MNSGIGLSKGQVSAFKSEVHLVDSQPCLFYIYPTQTFSGNLGTTCFWSTTWDKDTIFGGKEIIIFL